MFTTESSKEENDSEGRKLTQDEKDMNFGKLCSDEIAAERLSKESISEVVSGLKSMLLGMQTMERKIAKMEQNFEKSLSVTKNDKRKSKPKARSSLYESDEDSNCTFPGIFARQKGDNESDSDDSESSDSEDESDEKHSGNLRKILGTEFKHVNPNRGSKYSSKKEKRKSMLYSFRC